MCSNMRWTEHINQVSNKVRKMFYIFRELLSILDRRKLRIVYKAITESIISYGIVSWDGAYENVLKRLQTNQNALLRIALSMDYTIHTIDLFNKFYVLAVRKIYNKVAVTYLKKPNCSITPRIRSIQDLQKNIL